MAADQVPAVYDAEQLASTRSLVLSGALEALRDVSAKLDAHPSAKTDLRQLKAKLHSRIKQATTTLERIDPRSLDAEAKAAILACAAELDAKGGRFDLKSLAAKLRSLFPGAAAEVAKTAALTDVEKTKLLRAHLDKAVSAYNRGDFPAVEKLLTDQSMASRLGLSLKIDSMFFREDPATFTKAELDSVVLNARASSMSWDTGKVDIINAGLLKAPVEGQLPEMKSLGEMPVLAKQLLPIMLEEWMHQLQRLSGKPVSKLTEAYMASTGAKWDALHEMDIQAAFREWRFPVDEIGTVHAYPERGAFERWYQAQKK
ncbi:MAG: hypothetical protein U1E65_20235 [Myxococcota bacterium]